MAFATSLIGMGHNWHEHYRLGAKWPWVDTDLEQHGRGKLDHGTKWP